MTKYLKNRCEINIGNLINNYKHTVELTKKKVICVVKADAYGHGAVTVAKVLEKEGCDMFAVSCYNEALELRNSGITASILILGRIMPDEINDAVDNDISFAVGSLNFLQETAITIKGSKKAKIHIKLNTGMNRTGFDVIHEGSNDLDDACSIIADNKHIFDVEGVFSHFANAEDNASLCNLQYKRFCNSLEAIEKHGISPKIRHICNSAGTINCQDMYLDAVRLGIYLYGCNCNDKQYLPTMSFYSRILEVQKLKAGDGVSYGHDFIAEKNMKIAIIGAGYADGLFRCLSNSKGCVLYKGKKCPIIGRICMDMAMIDISHIDDEKVLDEVTIFGIGENGILSADEQAINAGTIPYELLCAVSKRVPRIYI